MDTLTHIALGACIGETLLGKKAGKTALWLGAAANSLPDIDFISASWLDPAAGLLAHRGFTHSLLFAASLVGLLSLAGKKWRLSRRISTGRWALFLAIEIGSHLFIDAFNAYGTGWFEPFSHERVTFNAVFVADPFFSCWPGLALLMLLLLKRNSARRTAWARAGWMLSSLYLLYCLFNKGLTDRHVRQQLAARHIHYTRYFSSPTQLNSWLWYIVAETDSGFNVGYRSVFDRGPGIDFHYFPRNEALLAPLAGRPDVQLLKRFSKGYYTIGQWKDTLVFNDLCFGQSTGWKDPAGRFSFHYYLQYPAQNRLVVQRGRFESWNGQVLKQLFDRIKGTQPPF